MQGDWKQLPSKELLNTPDFIGILPESIVIPLKPIDDFTLI